MPLEETIVIADELGIKHPVDPKTNEPIVMSTDFLLTVDKGEGIVEVARTVKTKEDLFEKRVLEKFYIERVYWKRRSIDWGIVTKLQIPKTFARNIGYIHEYHNLNLHDAFQNLNIQQIEDLVFSFLQRLLEKNESIREIANSFDKETHMPLGSGITLFYHLLARKIIQIDMSIPLDIEQRVQIQSVNEDKLKQVKYG